MKLSEELVWRGQVKDMTFNDVRWLDEPKTFYLGTDASSDSLTIGNLAIYMLARRLRKHGWQAVLLLGGATSLVGDPGGKDEERPLKSKEEVDSNIRAVKGQVEQLFNGMDFVSANNYDWFKDVGYLDFLREVGKHYSVTELVQRDFIASRLGEGGSGISYAEFSYSLVQGYDYWQLYKRHGVVLQIGGSDQWGNMLSGVPLIRKKENVEVHALSMPLVVNKTTGKKFGKSEEGAVWLDPDKTSVYKFYQFWLNLDDEGVEDYLKIYTELDKDTVDDIMRKFEADRVNRLAQKTLAREVTALVHGTKRAEAVERISTVLFGNDTYESLTNDDFKELQAELPFAEADAQADLVEILVGSGLAASNSEARRFLQDGAVHINGQPAAERTTLTKETTVNGFAVIRRGKNSMALVKLK